MEPEHSNLLKDFLRTQTWGKIICFHTLSP
uniref:Uncharacterized protein n=1 Tax=Arundo donax TaxID=35708 RepID=A0A0A8Z9A4_ARUDO